MAIICTTITYDDKELILFQIYLIYAERNLAEFYSSGSLRVLAYISTIISAAAYEVPDEMMCFPVC